MVSQVSKSIVVGLLLDESDEPLLRAAKELARPLGAPVHLVHALRPIFSYVGAGDIVVNPYYGHEAALSEQEEKRVRERLSAMSRNWDGPMPVVTHVVRDYPAEALLTISAEVHAQLLLCGIRKQTAGRFLSGLTTAFTLAAEAEVPVLMLPLGKTVDFARPLRMLVADNLEAEGQLALEAALELAKQLNVESLNHVFIHPISNQDVDALVESVRESMLLGKIPNNPEFSREFYLEGLRSRAKEELIHRLHSSKSSGAFQGTYLPRVGYGNPAEELHNWVRDTQCQLLVFGRHHILKRKNLALGRVPYHAMVEEGVATLVVPDTTPAKRK